MLESGISLVVEIVSASGIYSGSFSMSWTVQPFDHFFWTFESNPGWILARILAGWWNDDPIWLSYFSRGWNHQLVNIVSFDAGFSNFWTFGDVVYSGWSPLSRGVGASSWHRRSTCLFTNYRGLIWFDMSSGENGWKPWYVLVMFFFRRHLKRWRKNKTCHSFLYPFIPIWIHPTCNFWHSEDSELVDLVRHGSVSYWCGDLT